MSGGHYEYKYFQLQQLADDIESDFLNDGLYEDIDYTLSSNDNQIKNTIKYDRLSDANIDQKNIILKEIKSLIQDLRKCSLRAKELEWYLSGDTGATSYLERLNKILDEN